MVKKVKFEPCALTGIPAREFNAAGAAPGCTFVLPKEANELDFLKQFFPLQLILILILVAETCSEGRSQKLDRRNHGGTVCVHGITRRVFCRVLPVVQAGVENEMAIFVPCRALHTCLVNSYNFVFYLPF